MAPATNVINFAERKRRLRPPTRAPRPAWADEWFNQRAREAQRRGFERFMSRFGSRRPY
jgi:hypothetical protein